MGGASRPKRAPTASATRPAGTIGAGDPTIGAIGVGAKGVAANGVGVTIEAPGNPGPEKSGAGAADCGGARLRVWANAGGGGNSRTVAAAPTAATYRKAIKPHPDIAYFLDQNHG